MTEQLIGAIDDISGLNEIDAAELADKIIVRRHRRVRRDKAIPKRTDFEWWLALATVHAFAVEKITSQF